MNVGRRTALAAASVLLAIAAPTRGEAQPHPGRSESAVKAAFLAKFPAYVAWPASARPKPGARLHICIFGEDPLGRRIDEAVRGHPVDGHPLQVRRIGAAGSDAGCHVAFVSSGASGRLQSLKGKPVLTVTDSRDGGEAGMIHFVVRQGRVRFSVDEVQASASGLAISSRLLGIAVAVRRH